MGQDKVVLKEVTLFANSLKKKHGVQKVILFGSYAKGTQKKDSDVDLLIVSDSFKNKKSYARAPPIHLEWTLHKPVDLLCYTSEEFEKRKHMISIVREAVQTGVEL